MAVYFIRAGEDGPVKIGRTNHVPSRVAQLQAGNHLPLIVVRSVEGGPQEERYFHNYFSHLRITGEWFEFVPAMLVLEAHSNGLAKLHSPPHSGSGPMVELRRAVGCFPTQVSMADKLGCTASYLTKILHGERPLQPDMAIDIEAITAGIVTRHQLLPGVFSEAA